jgi:hypothetical protein
MTRLAHLDFLLATKIAEEEEQRQGAELLSAALSSANPTEPSNWQGSLAAWSKELPTKLRRAKQAIAKPKPLSLIIAAAVMLVLVAGMAYLGAPIYVRLTRGPVAAPPEMVGRLTGVFNVEWKGIQIGGSPGSHVPQGHAYVLQSGLIEVTLDRGTRVVVQGPAAVAFHSENSAQLQYGKAVAHVPRAARGFALNAPQAKIIDLGTSFGVASAKADDEMFIEVFEGSIKVRPVKGASTAPFTMRRGERISLRGAGKSMPDRDRAFVQHLPGSSRGAAVLVGFYPLDGNAHDESGNFLHGHQVSDIAWTDGYEGRAALFAGRPNSFIDLPINVNGDNMPILTWGAWVRPNIVAYRHTILSTDNGGFDRTLTIDERRGYESTNQFRYCAHGGPIAGELPSSCETLPAADKWVFVAAEYDALAESVTLFVENEHGQLHRDTFHDALPGNGFPIIRVGTHAGGTFESFNGAIDNLFVFRGRLDPNQLVTIQRGGAAAVLKVGAEFAPQEEHRSVENEP